MLEWWHWIVLGLVLTLAELAVPAFFIVWFGLGALGVGLVLLAWRSVAAWKRPRPGSAAISPLSQ